MREIKFRSWDGNKFHDAAIVNGVDWSMFCDGPTGNPIQQFTGLHDKNGKEIYEGDIIKFQIFANWDDENMARHTAKVIFRQGCFMWEIIKEGKQSAFHYSHLHQPLRDTCSTWGLEIIGNIYENPELLNKN